MSNTLAKQTLSDGERNTVVKVKITGDGSGDETSTLLIDFSDYSGSYDELKIMRIQSELIGFSVKLEWDASSNTDCLDIPAGESDMNFRPFGGLINNASSPTGDIDITTTGLGSGDEGTILLEMQKRNS